VCSTCLIFPLLALCLLAKGNGFICSYHNPLYLKAKKSFGQHFLNREDLAERIARSLVRTDDYQHVLEVGPGRGVLTKYLLERPEQLVVVEADRDMVLYLRKYYPQLKGHIVSQDFLQVPLDELFGQQPFALIGNFPYNISSQILFRMLEYRQYIPEMVGMFQKEVAERVIASEGSKTYGVISVLVQAYYEGEYLFTVDKRSFTPPPKVQSAVIRMQRRSTPLVTEDQAGLFRRVVKKVFTQRRKMLRNTLKEFIPDPEVLQEDQFRKRPEQLSPQAFVELIQRIATY
jgi:16S rRNA (adenine1518-N6/adenine1519-N6)-dimethyltransferase